MMTGYVFVGKAACDDVTRCAKRHVSRFLEKQLLYVEVFILYRRINVISHTTLLRMEATKHFMLFIFVFSIFETCLSGFGCKV